MNVNAITPSPTFSAVQSNFGAPIPPPPPGPPGPGYADAVEKLYSKTQLSRTQSERMARFAVMNNYGVDNFIAAQNDAYKISSVNTNDAWKYATLAAAFNAPPTKLRANQETAYKLSAINAEESLKLATYAVIRQSDTSIMQPTYDLAYKVSDINSQTATDLARIAVEASTNSPQEVLDSYQWYRSQPGGRDGNNALEWTRQHLADGFKQYADDVFQHISTDVTTALNG